MPISICFGRQFGSGGRDIARAVASELGFEFYDKELITLAAKESGLNIDIAEDLDERPTGSLLYSIVTDGAHFVGGAYGHHLPNNDKLYIAQSNVIKDISAKKNAVFVGRCADHILAEQNNVINVFVYANDSDRVARIMQHHNCTEKKAEEMMIKADKKRKNYYNFYTGKKWGAMQDHDLCVNSSLLGIEGTAKLIADFARQFKEK